MCSQNSWTGMAVGVVLGVLVSAVVALAGNLEPSGGPTQGDWQMYTLEQIYNRLNTGAADTKMTTFTEPSSGPGTSTMRTIDEIMTKAPALDATNGATAADVTSGKTFWGLTTGTWGLRTGTGSGGGTTYNAGVPRTGQTPTVPFPAEAGSDGALQKGVVWPVPRFTDNANGTVTDNLTGLIWLKNANCAGPIRTWANALSDVAMLNSAGTMNGNNCGDFSNGGSHQIDWRLPNVKELLSLIDYSGTPWWEDGNPFTGVADGYYWSSTTLAWDQNAAWVVELKNGYVSGGFKTHQYYVGAVRGGQ